MRFLGLALLTGAAFLSACGGGENKAADTTAKTDSAAMAAPTTTPAGGAVAKAPITGTMHEVKMIGDAQGYRFDPATINAKVGDGIRFVVTSGAPHNVAFDPATVPPDSKDQLFANGTGMTDGGSPMLVNPNETWELSLGGLKPGKYPFHCTPHLAMAMKGEINLTP